MEWKPSPVAVCRMDAASERTWTPCFYLPGQRVSGDGLQFMSRIAKIQDLPGRARLVGNTEKLTGQQWKNIIIAQLPDTINIRALRSFFFKGGMCLN